MANRHPSKIVVLLAVWGLLSCRGETSAPAVVSAGAADPHVEAARVYQRRCATCHGASGQGDGAVAAVLKPKPRDYRDPQWHREVKDDELAQTIVKGGAAVGKSHLMPDHPDLAARPDVVAALVARIRSFRRVPSADDAGTAPAPATAPDAAQAPNP